MIDTIILRLHHISQYPQIYEQYYNPTKKKNSVTRAMVDEDSGELIENTLSTNLIFHDSNRFIPLSFSNHINLPSSHYTLAVKLNTSADYLEFNFSIPKYKYATNLLQFVNLYNQSSDIIFTELQRFLNEFITNMFILQKPLLSDIEINRIDLCYNQFFNSKEDALQYLDAQKELVVKYARSSKNRFRTYDTSLMYITDRYSFKIYHKGTEFERNDLRKLMDANHKKYDLEKFQELSNCILRYEMTFRNSMLNYLVKQHLFEKPELDLKAETNHPVTYAYALLMRTDKNNALKYKTRAKKYCINSIYDYTNDIESIFNENTITFDKTIFQLLYDTFWKKVKDYQMTTCFSPVEVMSRLKNYNEQNQLKNKLRRKQQSGLSQFRILSSALLAQFMNIDELKTYLPETTFYTLKSDLKKVGIRGKETSINMPVPKLDYFDYKLYFGKYH